MKAKLALALLAMTVTTGVQAEKHDRLWSSVEAGMRVQPTTDYFLDTSYSRVFTIGHDRDMEAIPLEVGYQW